jgi:hypothetical protein
MLFDPGTDVDRNITEVHSAIPLFTIILTPKNQNNGSMFRYHQTRNGIRGNKGM